MELQRVSGAVPERLSGGDDSSENSSECSCYEVMDTSGEIVHMAKRLTCRVKKDTSSGFITKILKVFIFLIIVCLVGEGEDQRGHGAAAQPVQLCLLSVHLLGARGAHRGSSYGQPRHAFAS